MHVNTGKIAIWILVVALIILAITIWIYFDSRIHQAGKDLQEYRAH